jgi:hypothetical protein
VLLSVNRWDHCRRACNADAARLLAGADGDLLAGADVVPAEGRGAVGSQGAGIHVGPQHQVVLEVLVFVGDSRGAGAGGEAAMSTSSCSCRSDARLSRGGVLT